jgi:hypothetical protein
VQRFTLVAERSGDPAGVGLPVASFLDCFRECSSVITDQKGADLAGQSQKFG